MAEQDKYKESIKDEVIESVEVPQPKVEVEPKIEAQPSDDDIIITEEAPAPAPAPIVVTPPDESIKNQVKVLSDIAFEQGLDTAIEEAKKLGNPYILDEFHDMMVDELYKKLVEAGKLEQK